MIRLLKTDQNLSKTSVMRVKLLFVGLLLSSFFATVSPVWAETRQLDYTLTPEANQSFKGLIQQAEQLAEQMVKQSFTNPATTAIELKILAEREGLTTPILYVRVTRADWQKRSNLRSASTYLRGADQLLGFRLPQNSQSQALPTTVSLASLQSEPNYYDNP